jgi:hypothetical protein
MAMLSSATACAPITAHNATGSVNNLAAAFGEAGASSSAAGPASAAAATTGCSTSASGGVLHTITTSLSEQSRPLQGLAERFHGLTERLGSLSGLGSVGRSSAESEATNRTRTGMFISIQWSGIKKKNFMGRERSRHCYIICLNVDTPIIELSRNLFLVIWFTLAPSKRNRKFRPE